MEYFVNRRKAFRKVFAYVGVDVSSWPTTVTSSHPFTLEAGVKYAGIVQLRQVNPSTIATDQSDTVTIRGDLTGGQDYLAFQGFEFTASAVSTSIEVSATAVGGLRFLFLWKVDGYDYHANGSDAAAAGSGSILTTTITTAAGDVAIAAAGWATSTGNPSADDGVDTVEGTTVSSSRKAAGFSSSNLDGGSPETFTVSTDAGWKGGAGYFLVYR